MYLKLYWLVLLFSFVQCKENRNNIQKNNFNYTIYIQPFSDLDISIVKAVRDSIKKFYPYVEILEDKNLPTFCYSEKNKRYRADSLLRFLETNIKNNELIIGLTDKDISTTKDTIKDWGVMGLGNCPGKTCIASTFRLKAINRKSQIFKVAIHELGHTQGLAHCINKSCFMRDAEGKNPTNEEKEFCKNCTSFLKTKKWKL